MHLYLHIPFCTRRCSYCDFAIAVRRVVPVDEYIAALDAELGIRALGGPELATVYLGGGTPSKLGGTGVAAALDLVRRHFPIAPDAEVTLEANPEDVSTGAANAWKDAGVNRLSLGAQSFDPRVLEWMHRTHSAGDIGRAVREARSVGFGNLSLDLIFALPESLARDWDRDLDLALALEPEHLSVYGLTVEPATPLGRWSARGEVEVPPDDRWADEFELANRQLTAAGFVHYEVSNYASNNRRARHNSAYWLGVPYIGIGPAAHGYDGTSRRWNLREYSAWHDAILAGGDPMGGTERLEAGDRLAEGVYLGLRSDHGLEMEHGDAQVVDSWVEAGWANVAERHGSRILFLTAEGWQRLDALAAALTVLRSRC